MGVNAIIRERMVWAVNVMVSSSSSTAALYGKLHNKKAFPNVLHFPSYALKRMFIDGDGREEKDGVNKRKEEEEEEEYP